MNPRLTLLLSAFLASVVIECTDETKLQNMHGPKGIAPPPTAQTPGPIWLIFGLKVSRESTNGGTVAIFEFPPPTRDIRGYVVT